MTNTNSPEISISHKERLHPVDRLPVSATPIANSLFRLFDDVSPAVQATVREEERRARAAEADLAEARRVIAWLWTGKRWDEDKDYGWALTDHLDSTPPPEWKP